MQPSAKGSVEERKVNDSNKCEELFSRLGLSHCEVVDTHRIGKPVTGRPRLLKVILKDTKSKREILRRAKMLKSISQFRHVYINPDRTLMQQLERKKLYQELKSRREAGEDDVILKQSVIARASIENFQKDF